MTGIRRTSFASSSASIIPATTPRATDIRARQTRWDPGSHGGALKRDAQPAIYYHTIEYAPPSSDARAPRKTLRGFLTTTKLEPLDSGQIYPHENTRSAAKTDRLNLLKACKANLSPIWLLYSDPQNAILGLLERAVKGQPPRIDFQDDNGCRQRLWAVTDPAVLGQIVDIMASKPLFIADGHHRYETALNYQRFRREQAGTSNELKPYDGVLMLLSPLEDPGLTVLPTHRVTTTPLPPMPAGQVGRSATHSISRSFPLRVHNGRSAGAIHGCIAHTRTHDADLRPRTQGGRSLCDARSQAGASSFREASPRTKLDVSLLQQLVVEQLCPTQQEQEAILYTKDDHEALDWAANGTGTGALLLNATKVSEVQAVATGRRTNAAQIDLLLSEAADRVGPSRHGRDRELDINWRDEARRRA